MDPSHQVPMDSGAGSRSPRRTPMHSQLTRGSFGKGKTPSELSRREQRGAERVHLKLPAPLRGKDGRGAHLSPLSGETASNPQGHGGRLSPTQDRGCKSSYTREMEGAACHADGDGRKHRPHGWPRAGGSASSTSALNLGTGPHGSAGGGRRKETAGWRCYLPTSF